ncbi:hypothetical protein BJV74DRAFT_899719 [Russula compacta]|nr:hypothetical protein BJV74DRAFT_899719 [Russula compacta]
MWIGSLPPSSIAPLSAPVQVTEDKPNEIRAIWGIMVNLANMMKTFRKFIKGFKPKYCIMHNCLLGWGTKAMSSSVSVEVLLYKSYLRWMCITGKANLNLDCKNLHAFPLSHKLYGQLVKYLQEVILVMDHMLKDIMLKLMEEDQVEGHEGMVGQEGKEEIADIMSKV